MSRLKHLLLHCTLQQAATLQKQPASSSWELTVALCLKACSTRVRSAWEVAP